MTTTGNQAIDKNPATSKKALISWCLYDWANSAYPTLVVTFIFAAYFTQGIAPNKELGTALWGNAMGISGLLIAFSAPFFGALADQMGRRKPWLGLFTLITIVSTSLLWFAAPDEAYIWWALGLVIISNLGFEVGMVFYNAMLPDLVSSKRLGRLSGWAWALGYAGGLTCLVIALYGFVQADPAPFGLSDVPAGPVRATVLLVAIWFALFALPLFLWVPDTQRKPVIWRKCFGLAFSELRHTLKQLISRDGQLRQAGRFLLARMLYIDGLNTLFAFGGIYAAGTFGMSFQDIIVFGIAMNVSAGLGAFGFGWLDDKLGAKPTITFSLIAMILLGTALIFIEDVTWFWITALTLGVFFGPVQASSRSLMARLAPPDLRNELFGLYALSGKITSFLGPLVLGWVTLMADSQRAGMATILVFLIAGLWLLHGVRAPSNAGD